MEMMSRFDVQGLDKLLKDFYTVVGIRISIFDSEFNLVTEYPKTAPSFCSNIRNSKEGLNGCRECDKAACERAKKVREPHIYTCHAGITEAITAIHLGGGVLGYAILAHMFPTENYEQAVANACVLAKRYGVAEEESAAAVSGISKRTTEEIKAAVRMLDAIASYVYIRNLVQWRNEDISASIEAFIKSNLKERIANDSLCKRFNCSRSSLYQLSMKAFGMGITEYILHCRIEKAKELLLSGKTIAETAGECGFGEYNYFCRVFKNSTGFTPTAFRDSYVYTNNSAQGGNKK